MPLFQTVLLILGVSAVAVADVFLKKGAASHAFLPAFVSPWTLAAIALYILQIAIFLYLFLSGSKLSFVGVLQTVVYAFIILAAAFFLFHESLSLVQMTGVGLAVLGVILMNL